MAEPTAVEIAPMRQGDLEAILRIEREAFDDPWSRDNFLHELRDNPYARCFSLLGAGGDPIGYACVWIVGEELWINNIAVAAPHRGRGHGRRLLEAILEAGRGRGCRVARLDVRPSNRPALALYRRFGFRVVGARKGYYGGGREDGWVMARDLDSRPRGRQDPFVEGESGR